MHCFSGDISVARECVERGYLLSFAGTVTFKNAGSLRDALAVTPLEQVLVETDAPYLTPSPWRGSANSPYLLPSPSGPWPASSVWPSPPLRGGSRELRAGLRPVVRD